MGTKTAIAWCDSTHNPWVGCSKVGPGCDFCYAESLMDKRYGRVKWGPGQERKRTSLANWRLPLKWNRQAEASDVRRKVFCASLADVFDNEVPDKWRDDLFALIRETPNLDWILLTKRIGNVAKMLPEDWGDGYPNVWLLITVVNQEEANRDIPKLLDTPAIVRGLSIEPQLSDINLREIHRVRDDWTYCDNALSGFRATKCGGWGGPRIDWVISGAESGPNGRPYDDYWARTLRDQCALTCTPFFFKQVIIDGKKIETPLLDGRRHMEYPK